MKIKTVTAWTALFSLAVLSLLVFDLFQLLNIHHDVVKSEEARFQSYKLAEQLRQSSDDLTRMARTYVVTGDEQYKKNYFAILDIRNGKLPRPHHYSNTYWWHAADPGGSDGAEALQSLMRRAGFSEAEFALLAESQARSDALVGLEKEAFDAMQGRFADARKGRAPDPAFAQALLFGARYHGEKDRIMQPIDAFLQSVDRRTSQDLRALEARQAAYLRLALAIAVIAGMVTLSSWGYLYRRILRPVLALRDHVASLTGGAKEKIETVNAVAEGNLEHDIAILAPAPVAPGISAPNEVGQLTGDIGRMSEVQRSLDLALRAMTQALRSHRERDALLDWHKSGINEVNLRMRGEVRLADMGPALVSFLSTYVGAAVGALYLYEPQRKMLNLLATHALSDAPEQVALGEGVAGAAAEQRRVLQVSGAPASYPRIKSSTGHAPPAAIVAVPLLHEGKLFGLIEVSGFQPFTERHLDWLARAGEALAIAIDVAQSRERVNELLMQTQAQTEELRVQQEELQQSNEELEERALLLEQQREIIRKRSQETEAAGVELVRKAAELERVSAYKSEFLANMSHELRTPLNSMLILSSLLQQNKGGRLDAKEIEYAATIHGAGRDLLNLINDILDLSKIEAGQMAMHIETVDLAALLHQLQALFTPVAEQKNLVLHIEQLPDTPASLRSDEHRLLQILRNLLGNAFKFTTEGEIAVTVAPCADSPLQGPALAFMVRDSGIGIAPDKHELIFQAFQQADGSTARKYGGSGLGLSISRQLAQRLGGDITLASAPGQGSTFTLYLPLPGPAAGKPDEQAPLAALPVPPAASAAPAPAPPGAIEDDRALNADGRRTILIVEDDPAFARILRDKVREQGFLALVACDGEAGLALAERHAPQAIILDVMLPQMDGWGVMRRIQENQATRDIPVHFITCSDDRQRALDMGAAGFASKPVSAVQLEQIIAAIDGASSQPGGKRLLVAGPPEQSAAMAALLARDNLDIVEVHSGADVLAQWAQGTFDCVVLNLGLSDMDECALLERLLRTGDAGRAPVIVHSEQQLLREEITRLERYTEHIIIKGARSQERLLGEVSLFLHQVKSALPRQRQAAALRTLDKEAVFAGCTVLLVDDDIRNVFSLSAALGGKAMRIVHASNGREALEQLEAYPAIDIVLMDVMMPEMDGFEAMRRIRAMPRWRGLPIIALTAKAMASDRQHCLDAGASDYIAKPVDIDKLFSLMRVWLYRDANKS
ncbi:response regulator [Duganella sp. FT92W]|uniref:Virulence sensor protein BvgS n=1 Tax=Pseudoduganella rivuli TaxID=2666085 RepID=A0A7X2LR20_9BURK|nr:response regulator [Pseudoduganella rivuli]MRV70756.1 response regulator [Pseudoduganella rivuli]